METLGPYRSLVKQPSAEPMVAVFAAQHGTTGKRVELRVLKRFLMPDDAASVRFLQAMETIRGIDHPRLPRLRDFGNLDGTVFYALEARETVTLRDYLEENLYRLSPLLVLDLLLPVGEALAAMHEKGIAHRDVSPDSIRIDRVTETAGIGHFGMLRILRLPTLTDSGFQLPFSTAAHTPEAEEGWEEDSRTDLYLFATVIHHAVTGVHLPTSVEVARGWTYLPDHFAAPSSLLDGFCAGLDEPLAKALRYRPEERPASMQLLCAELRESRLALSMEARPKRFGARRTQAIQAARDMSRRDLSVRGAAAVAAPGAATGRFRKAALGIVGVLLGIVAMLGFLDPGSPAVPSGPRYRRAEVAPPDPARLRERLVQVAGEARTAPTRRETFEERQGILRAWVSTLSPELREKHFPKASLADLRILYFRDPKAGAARLDDLLALAAKVASGS